MVRCLASVIAATAVVLAMPFAAAADSSLCGRTITADLMLTEDLVCDGTGLIAGADGITIDPGGHTIQGVGPGAAYSSTSQAP